MPTKRSHPAITALVVLAATVSVVPCAAWAKGLSDSYKFQDAPGEGIVIGHFSMEAAVPGMMMGPTMHQYLKNIETGKRHSLDFADSGVKSNFFMALPAGRYLLTTGDIGSFGKRPTEWAKTGVEFMVVEGQVTCVGAIIWEKSQNEAAGMLGSSMAGIAAGEFKTRNLCDNLAGVYKQKYAGAPQNVVTILSRKEGTPYEGVAAVKKPVAAAQGSDDKGQKATAPAPAAGTTSSRASAQSQAQPQQASFSNIGSGTTGLSFFSGRTMGSGMALNFSIGAPDASFTFAGALGKNLDLGGVLRLGYLNPIGFGAGGFWMSLAATARYTLLDRGKFNLAIRGDFGPVFNIVNNFIANAFMGGFTMAPYVLAGIPIRDIVSLNFGFGLPIFLLFRDSVTVAGIPIAFAFGTEIFIQKNLTFNFTGELGPGIWVCTVNGATTSGAQFYGLFKVGISYGL